MFQDSNYTAHESHLLDLGITREISKHCFRDQITLYVRMPTCNMKARMWYLIVFFHMQQMWKHSLQYDYMMTQPWFCLRLVKLCMMMLMAAMAHPLMPHSPLNLHTALFLSYCLADHAVKLLFDIDLPTTITFWNIYDILNYQCRTLSIFCSFLLQLHAEIWYFLLSEWVILDGGALGQFRVLCLYPKVVAGHRFHLSCVIQHKTHMGNLMLTPLVVMYFP